MVAATTSFWATAVRASWACPSCRAPMVGTRPWDVPPFCASSRALAARSWAAVVTSWIAMSGSFQGGRPVLAGAGERLFDAVELFRLQESAASCPAGCRPGHGQVRLKNIAGRAAVVLAEGAGVRGHRAGVAAGHGPGQGRFTGGEGVLEGGAQQRAQHPVRGVDADVAEQLRGLRHERDQVVGSVREGSVVEDTG